MRAPARRIRALALACAAAHAPVALAQSPAPAPAGGPGADGATWAIEGAAQVVAQSHPFWGLAQTFAPAADYDDRSDWIEAYLRPSVQGVRAIDPGTTVRGGLSLLGSATLGQDLFQQGGTGRLLLDDAYLGLQRRLGGGARLDLSFGAQRYVLGQGMLLAVGAGNGFERGAATLAPRRAWEMTAIAGASFGPATVEAFYLDPNELKSGDTRTRLAGARIEWAPNAATAIGLARFSVLRSDAPYPQAPVTIVDGGRDGLDTTDLYWRHAPTEGELAGFSFAGELAWQRNGRIGMQARGLAADIGYRFAGLPFSPRLSWSPRYFSGDDPATPDRLERFDPLFYDGSPATWSSGGNGSFAFYNSNLVVHRFRLELALSQVDFVNLNYWNVRAAQANSPLQYGQAARIAFTGGGIALISGVTDRALSQEFYFEYTRVLSRSLFLTAGLAVALPDDGIEALVPGGARTWLGGLVNLTYRH